MNRKDLTGKTFGLLTAISSTDQRNGNHSILWKCRCNCGNEELVLKSSSSLVEGKTKSCGCLGKYKGGRKPKDFTGLIINNILLLRRSEERSGENFKWYARCPECLREDWLIAPSQLRPGYVTRCSKCSEAARTSKTANILLDKVENFYHLPVLREYKINYFHFDGYIPKLNLLIESDGSYWHSSDKMRTVDKRKNKLALELGYRLIRVKNDGPRDIEVAFIAIGKEIVKCII